MDVPKDLLHIAIKASLMEESSTESASSFFTSSVKSHQKKWPIRKIVGKSRVLEGATSRNSWPSAVEPLIASAWKMTTRDRVPYTSSASRARVDNAKKAEIGRK